MKTPVSPFRAIALLLTPLPVMCGLGGCGGGQADGPSAQEIYAHGIKFARQKFENPASLPGEDPTTSPVPTIRSLPTTAYALPLEDSTLSPQNLIDPDEPAWTLRSLFMQKQLDGTVRRVGQFRVTFEYVPDTQEWKCTYFIGCLSTPDGSPACSA